MRIHLALLFLLQVSGFHPKIKKQTGSILSNKVKVSDAIDVAGKVIEGGFDVAEDILTHVQRMPIKELENEKDLEKLVILGSGWGAHAMIKVLDVKKYNVIVISPTNNFIFTPFLPAIAVGTVDARSASETVRRSNPLVEYVDAKAIDVDFKEKTVQIEYIYDAAYDKAVQAEISYDKLIIATGVQVNTAIAQGANEYSFKLKTAEDAIQLRRAITTRLERAAQTNIDQEERRRLLTFVICGGGPTAIELAGELSDFNNDIKARFPKLESMPKVIVIEAAPNILPPFSQEQRAIAQETLENAGVQFILNTFVKEVSHSSVTLFDRKEEKSYNIPCGIVVWAAGTTTLPFIQNILSKLPESGKEKGKIAVDQWLRLNFDKEHHAFGDVYALGDCAHIIGTSLPQTAQVASQAGAYLARYFNRRYDTKSTPPIIHTQSYLSPFEKIWITGFRQATEAPKFSFLNLGILAYLGAGQALARVQLGNIPLRNADGKEALLSGVQFILQNKFQPEAVFLFFLTGFKTRLFGRDITRL